jgi:hypothetical protein
MANLMLIKGWINKEEYKQILEIKNKEERDKEIAEWAEKE